LTGAPGGRKLGARAPRRRAWTTPFLGRPLCRSTLP
jgi:hypothetical protein